MMADDSLIVDFLVRKNEIFSETIKVDKSMRLLDESFKSVMGSNNQLDASFGKTGAAVTEVNDILRGLNKQIKENAKSATGFDMNMLRMLFTGMALQKTFGGLFRSMSNTFNKLEEGSSKGQENMMNLQAGFEFFKFSVFDAIASTDLFAGFVDKGISTLKTLANILSDPQLSETILMVSTIGFTLGAGLTGVAVIKQLGGLIASMLADVGITTSGSLATGLSITGATVGIAMTISDIKATMSKGLDSGNLINNILDIAGDIITTAGFVLLATNPATGGIVIGVGLGIRFLPEILDFVGEGIFNFMNIFKEAGDIVSTEFLGKDLTGLANSYIQPIQTATSIIRGDYEQLPSAMDNVNFTLITQNDKLQKSYIDVAEAAREAANAIREVGDSSFMSSSETNNRRQSSITREPR